MTHTGLRISDAVLFDMDRLHGNDVFLPAKKNGGHVNTWIPDWLRDRLAARATRHGKQPFMIGGTKRLDTVIDTWRQRLARVFELADIGTEKATPHRFRHTFARILLQRGFWNAVGRVRLLSSDANLDDAGLVFDEQPNGFTAKSPHLRERVDAVVSFKR
jgi:integrase